MTETATTPTTTQDETQTTEQPATLPHSRNSRRAGKLQPCFCSTIEAGEDIGDEENPDVTIETTGCTQMTNRTFAQGHDAKLVSFLVAAELAGKDIRYGRDGGMVITTDAVGAAKLVSEELAAKARTALDNGKNKLAKVNERKAAKAQKGAERAAALQAKLDAKKAAQAEKEAAAAKTESTDEVQVPNIPAAKVAGKVGRWEYKGTVNEDGSFTFTNGSGKEETVAAGKWSPLES